jgi:signal transduction histidine kinase
VKTRTHEQTTLLKISHTLASTLEFQPGLILDQLHEIIPYTHGGLFALEDSTLSALAIRGVNQLDPAPPFHIHLQGPEVLSTLFVGHKPVRVADVWSEHPQAQLLRSLLLDETAGLLEGIRSWMWVPLAVRGHIIGVIGVAEIRRNFFTIHQADLALSVANQAAITMVNADLIKQAQELAVLEERQRLARNLHDAVNQSLFSAGLIAEVLTRLWEKDHKDALRSLDDLRRLTRGAQAEMRALLAELRPSTITDSKLGDLLRLLGNALTGRTSIPVEITAPEEMILPPDVQITFYRICQETLNNVAKHSKANHVNILLRQEGNDVVLRIHDDGKGFDPNQTISGHYGLGMMHERAESAGALFSVSSRPGEGTDIILHWIQPIQKET